MLRRVVLLLPLSTPRRAACVGGDPPAAASLQTLDYFAEASEPTHTHTLMLVLGTCFLALLVNWCSFGLIGRTSPITFQVRTEY